MHYVARVHVVDPTEDLVHEVLKVGGLQLLLRVDEVVQVGFHQLGDEVHVVIRVLVVWPLDVQQLYDVLVVEEFYNWLAGKNGLTQDLDFPEDSFGVYHVLESFVDPLDGHFLLTLRVLGAKYMAVGTCTNAFVDSIVLINCDYTVSRVKHRFALDLARNRPCYILPPLLLLRLRWRPLRPIDT